MKIIIFLLMILLSSSLLYANWELTGPGHSAVSSVFIDGNNLYVSASSTGTRVYHSTNNGDSWKILNDYNKSPFEYVVDIIVNNNKIFVGTLKGLYTTTDEGKNWVLDTIDGKVSIVWDLKKRGDDIFMLTNSGRLYLSKDNGQNWGLLTPVNMGGWEALAIDNNNIYLGGIGFTNEPNLMISHDNGKNWKKTNDTLTGLVAKEIISLASNGDNIYVGTKDNGLYISSDKGETWEISNSYNLNSYPLYCLFCKGDIVYAGNDLGFYYSKDKGQNWVKSPFTGHVYNINVNNDVVYLASSEGLGISTDFGETWTIKQRGLGSLLVFDIAKHNNNIFAGTYQQGVFVSYDETNTWSQFNSKFTYASIIKIAFLDSSMFTSTYFTGYLEYSNDLGKSWESATYLDSSKIDKINCIAIDNNKKNIFVSSRDSGLYVSSDFGKSWSLFTKDLHFIIVNDIDIHDDEIYVATQTMGIFISTDYGNTWVNYFYQNELPNVVYSSIIFCQNNIIAGTYVSNNKEIKGLYFSKDKGKSWVQTSDSIALVNIRDLITYGNNVFAASDKGILLSSNCGENWFRQENSLSTIEINKLLIVGKNIYAATPEGVFKAPLSDFGITNVDDNHIEKRNYLYLYSYPPYPTPSKNIVNTLIYWDTSIDIDNDQIDIIDIFGNKIGDRKDITINKQTKYSGILTWNCSGVPNGIYFILINHGTEKKAIKILINK